MSTRQKIMFYFIFSLNIIISAQTMQTVFYGKVDVLGSLSDEIIEIQVFDKTNNFIRNTNYNSEEKTYSISLYSSDGLKNGDSLVFVFLSSIGNFIARTSGNSPIFNGAVLPNPPKIFNIDLFNNVAPFFDSLSNYNAKEGQLFVAQISATDLNGDILNSSSSNIPAWLSIYSSTGEIRGIPGFNDLGENSFTLNISDSWGGIDTVNIKINVTRTKPIHPNLSNPINLSVDLKIPVNCTWLKSERAEFYTFQLSKDSTFNLLVLDSNTLTDTIYTLTQLENFTTYYWRINASNSDGTSTWSEAWNFKTLGVPTIVKPLLPLANSVNQPIELDFVWSKSEDQLSALLPNGEVSSVALSNSSKKYDGLQSISNYWFELNKDTSSLSIVVDSTLSDTTKHIANLENITNYYWRIRAKNETGWGGYSSWSMFTTIIDTPYVVVLKSPLNNSVGNIQPVIFTWFSSNLEENYILQISRDEGFTSNVVDTTGLVDTSFISQELENGIMYYWRVKSVNIGGESVWSEVWNLETKKTPPKPILISPANNSEFPDSASSIVFLWSSVEFSERYTLEASIDSSFNPLFIDTTAIDTTVTYLEQLSPSIFYWRVRGENIAGAGEWSETFVVTIVTDVENIENIIPQEFILHQNYPNPFNPTTMVKYGVPLQSNIKIEIFNMLGQSVGILVNEEKTAGFYNVTWNASNLPSGVYLISIRAEGLDSKNAFTQVKKALLLK